MYLGALLNPLEMMFVKGGLEKKGKEDIWAKRLEQFLAAHLQKLFAPEEDGITTWTCEDLGNGVDHRVQ